MKINQIKTFILRTFYRVFFLFMRVLPLKNKVVASTMRGRKFSDNPRFIIEALHQMRPDLDIVWFSDDRWPQD